MPTLRKRKPLHMKANDQYCLDFGQKKGIEPTRCSTCGMLYVIGEESDEKEHAKYHADFDEGVRWSVRVERVKKYFDDCSRIIQIKHNDPKTVIDAVTKLLKTAEGADEILKSLSKANNLFLIYVNQSNHMIGYVVAEKIEEAFIVQDYRSPRLEGDPNPAECGIVSLWVNPKHRRRNIGTWLLDSARANLIPTKVVRRSKLAVGDFNETSLAFLQNYLKQRPIMVYQS